mgnify:CR=1 FL=1
MQLNYSKGSLTNNSVFSRDVTAAILVSLNKGTAAMLVSPTNPPRIELFLCKRFLLLCICNRIGSRAIAMTYLSHKGQNFWVIVNYIGITLRFQATYDQSASSNHALVITTSTLVIKKKCPLSQPISIQKFCLACDKLEKHAHWSREWKHSIHFNRALESWHLGILLSNL